MKLILLVWPVLMKRLTSKPTLQAALLRLHLTKARRR
jgi:hypothetical protein